jgi:hypothetical protein
VSTPLIAAVQAAYGAPVQAALEAQAAASRAPAHRQARKARSHRG